MPLLKKVKLVLGLVVMIAAVSCSTTENTTATGSSSNTEIDNRYDSEFPSKSIAREIDFISTTVKKLDCIAFYMTYVFPPGNHVEPSQITDNELKELSVSNSVSNESVSGTATIIYSDGIRIGLLTAAHVIDFPDTIITRYDNGEGPIEVISIKLKQQNYVKELPGGSDVEIIAVDQKHDIAFLSKKLDESSGYIPVLNLPLGKTNDLDWGSIVYVVGYPVGQLMVTRALVSNPEQAKRGRFLTDALYNRGISGSPVFAIRDGVPNFEIVGIATSAAAKQLFYLKPGKNLPEYLNPDQPYTGDLYAEHYKNIKYGVTFNVSIEVVKDFLKKNYQIISGKGFNPEQFFK